MRDEISSKQAQFWATLVLYMVAFGVSLLLCVLVTKNILDNIDSVHNKLDFITSHKALNETIEIKSKDKIGQMAQSVNVLSALYTKSL